MMKTAVTLLVIAVLAVVWLGFRSCGSQFNLQTEALATSSGASATEVINANSAEPAQETKQTELSLRKIEKSRGGPDQFGLYADGKWDQPLVMIDSRRGNVLEMWDSASAGEIYQVNGQMLYLCSYPALRALGDTEWKHLDPPHDGCPELIDVGMKTYHDGDIGIGQMFFSKPGRYAYVVWDKGAFLFNVTFP